MDRWTDDQLDASFDASKLNAEEISMRGLSRAYLSGPDLIPIRWHEHDYKTLTLCFACNAKPICKNCCSKHFKTCL